MSAKIVPFPSREPPIGALAALLLGNGYTSHHVFNERELRILSSIRPMTEKTLALLQERMRQDEQRYRKGRMAKLEAELAEAK